MTKDDFKKLKIPDTPGVYFFKKGDAILYIGKATSLRDRVKSYFHGDVSESRGPVIKKLIEEANVLRWQKTESVLEALILESLLIKKYQPAYNTKDKSNKSFNYIRVTKEKLPRVLITRGKELKEHRHPGFVFGPYPNGSELKTALKILRPIFPYLDDNVVKSREFYRQIDLMPDVSSAEKVKAYRDNIKNLILFFKGKKGVVFKNLKKEMKSAAKIREFERAGEIKKQLFALQHINDVALIKNNLETEPEKFRIEAYDIAHLSGKSMVGVMVTIEDGEAAKKEYRKFEIKTQIGANDTGALGEILSRRLTHREWRFPNLIVVDGGEPQINIAKRSVRAVGLDAPIVSVVKDERHKPKDILGEKESISRHRAAILLANTEAHRFAISYHKNLRAKNFLK